MGVRVTLSVPSGLIHVCTGVNRSLKTISSQDPTVGLCRYGAVAIELVIERVARLTE